MSELQCVKFGDLAQQITTKVNPKDTSLNTYVGLEHLDTGSLQIKRRGTPQDVIGEKLRVCKGDIIFGKRRVYQRKLAIADFDGICSAHAMVLRPKEDVVDKDFFPFFLQSDLFMERALQISVGSLSPTINWKTLAVQEFTIPSLSDQHRIATTLWAAEDCIVKGERFVAAAERAKQVLMRELFSKGIGHTEFKEIAGFGKVPIAWNILKVKDFASVIRGSSPRPKGDSRYYNGPVPRLMTEDVTRDGKWVHAKIDSLTEEGAKLSRFLEKGSLVIICSGGKETVGLPGLLTHDACVHDGFLALKKINGEFTNIEFLYYWILHYQKTMEQIATHGCAFINLTTDIISDLKVTVPPLPEQRQIAGILTRCDETIAAARANVAAAKALKMKMINEMLSPEN